MKSIPSSNEQVICLSTAQVRRTLKRVNPYKVARPDNIPGQMLKECAEQLTDTLTDVLNPLWARQSFQHVSRPPQSFQYQKKPQQPNEQLLPCGTHSSHHEVVWETSHEPHDYASPDHQTLSSLRTTLTGLLMLPCPLHFTCHSSNWQEGFFCKDAIHWLHLSL